MLFVGKMQDEALEDGYLERLFLKESHEQGVHFDAPTSIAKIVIPRPLATPTCTLPYEFPQETIHFETLHIFVSMDVNGDSRILSRNTTSLRRNC